MLDYTREVLAAAHADITVAKGFGYEAIPIVETFLSIGDYMCLLFCSPKNPNMDIV